MLLGILAIERRRPPDDLDDLGVERARQLVGGIANVELRLTAELELDELARAERVVERLEKRRRHPVVTDLDERLQVVRLGAQRGALLGGQRHAQGTPVSVPRREDRDGLGGGSVDAACAGGGAYSDGK
jgi:hypothetical protein